MDDLDSRSNKRRLAAASTSSSSYKTFHDDGNSEISQPDNNAEPATSKFYPKECLYSVESLLSVPLAVIFREIGDGTTQSTPLPNSALRKPWPTRAEAHCLLQISMLAYEVDVLVQLAEEEFARRQLRRSFRSKLVHTTEPPGGGGETEKKCKKKVLVHPYLRPIIPFLAIQDRLSSHGYLQYVQVQLDRAVLGLKMCSGTLRNSCEQNYTYADNLDALDDGLSSPGRILAQEKRKLAELEEELCQRVENILQDNIISSANAMSLGDPGSVEELDIEPMNVVCAKIFGLPAETWASQYDTQHHENIGMADTFCSSATKTDRTEDDSGISASQSSYVQKSDAAEVLAVLAMGNN